MNFKFQSNGSNLDDIYPTGEMRIRKKNYFNGWDYDEIHHTVDIVHQSSDHFWSWVKEKYDSAKDKSLDYHNKRFVQCRIQT